MMNEEDTGHSATDDQSRLSAQSFYSLQWENGRKEAASSVSSFLPLTSVFCESQKVSRSKSTLKHTENEKSQYQHIGVLINDTVVHHFHGFLLWTLAKKWYWFYQNSLNIEQNLSRLNQFLVTSDLCSHWTWNCYMMWHNHSRSEDFGCLPYMYDKWDFWPMRFQWVGLFRRKPSNRQNLSLIGGYSWLDLHVFSLRSYCFITSCLFWTQFYIWLALCIMCFSHTFRHAEFICLCNIFSHVQYRTNYTNVCN